MVELWSPGFFSLSTKLEETAQRICGNTILILYHFAVL